MELTNKINASSHQNYRGFPLTPPSSQSYWRVPMLEMHKSYIVGCDLDWRPSADMTFQFLVCIRFFKKPSVLTEACMNSATLIEGTTRNALRIEYVTIYVVEATQGQHRQLTASGRVFFFFKAMLVLGSKFLTLVVKIRILHLWSPLYNHQQKMAHNKAYKVSWAMVISYALILCTVEDANALRIG